MLEFENKFLGFKFAIGWKWIIDNTSQLIVLHDSLLPKYRGFSPLVNSLINGDTLTGVTALFASSEYDKGEIIEQAQIGLDKNSTITKLRVENTKLCVQLTLSALSAFNQLGFFISKPQQRKGHYYSFMPAELKEICVKNFEQYIQKL